METLRPSTLRRSDGAAGDGSVAAELRDVALASLSGAAKGFLLCFLPMTLLRRRIAMATLRKSLSIATFVGTFQAVHRYLEYLERRNRAVAFSPPEPMDLGSLSESGLHSSAFDTTSRSRIIKRLVQYVLAYRGVDPRHYTLEQQQQLLVARLLVTRFRRAIASAAAASLLSLVDDGSMSNSVFVFWLLVRAVRCIVPLRGPAPSWMPVSVLAISSSLILSSWIKAPEDLDPTYLRFLTTHGQQPKALLHYVQQNPINVRTCGYLHPGQGCIKHAFGYWFKGFRLGLQLYVPLSLVMFLFSRQKRISNLVASFLRSCCFLASYCTLAMCPSCIVYRYVPGVSRVSLMAHTWLAGLAVLFERPSRQVELASYVCTYALDNLYRTVRNRTTIKPSRTVSWLLLMTCFAILFHHHEQQPGLVTQWLLEISPPEDHNAKSKAEKTPEDIVDPVELTV